MSRWSKVAAFVLLTLVTAVTVKNAVSPAVTAGAPVAVNGAPLPPPPDQP